MPEASAVYRPNVVTTVVTHVLPLVFLASFLALVFRNEPTAASKVFWIVAALISAWFIVQVYWLLSWRLEFDGAVLRWRGLLRGGEIPVSELRGVNFVRYISPLRGQQTVRFVGASGTAVSIVSGAGLIDFVAKLVQANPDLRVQTR